jgi:hypothetical protein
MLSANLEPVSMSKPLQIGSTIGQYRIAPTSLPFRELRSKRWATVCGPDTQRKDRRARANNHPILRRLDPGSIISNEIRKAYGNSVPSRAVNMPFALQNLFLKFLWPKFTDA